MIDRMNKASGGHFRWILVWAIIGIICWISATHSVAAQVVPERTDPPADQAVPVMPSTIEVWFAEGIRTEGTTLEVQTADGTRVDMGNTKLDLQDPAHPLVTVGVHPGLDNGVYTVRWTTVSAVDGIAASGSYQFTIDPGASPQALPQVATQQAAVPLPANDGNDDSSKTDRNPWFYRIGAVVAGLVLLGFVFFWFLRRPSRGRRWRDDVVDRL